MAIKHRLCHTIYAAQPLNPGSKLFFNFLWWGPLKKLWLAENNKQHNNQVNKKVIKK